MSHQQVNKRQVDRWVAWVNENRPHVALWGDPEIRRIVVHAVEHSSVVRFWLTMSGAIAGAFVAYHVSMLVFDRSFDKWQGGLAVGAFAALLTLLTSRFTDVLIVRKIDSLASGNRQR